MRPLRPAQVCPFSVRAFAALFIGPQTFSTTNNFMKRIVIIACAAFALSSIAALAVDAKENWEKTCAKCHGAEGKGDTKMGQKLEIKDLTDAKTQASFTDDQAAKAIKEGVKDSEGKMRMKAIEGLSDDEIKVLVAKVRTLKK
jgi:cytochrome c553